jgi:cardiolipin synthase (CMP-forming)
MRLPTVLDFVLWLIGGLALTVVLVWGVRRGRGARGQPLRIADWITIARLALIAPMTWLLVRGHFLPAAVCYFILGGTDVVDGIVARRRGETSAFGMFLDPLADILSTAAVFTVFVLDGFIPRWLYVLLLLRYVPLAVAALVLTRTTGPVDFSSTVPGKIVGVLQAAAAFWVMVWAARGVHPAPGSGPLFAFLAAGFVSIVVSQTVIGYRHVRRASPGARG